MFDYDGMLPIRHRPASVVLQGLSDAVSEFANTMIVRAMVIGALSAVQIPWIGLTICFDDHFLITWLCDHNIWVLHEIEFAISR